VVDTTELTRVEQEGSEDPELERLRLATARRLLRDLPDRIGRYRVVAKVGEGGMGTVYRAHDPELDRPVALKVLKTHGSGPSGVAEQARMLREARALAAISHPHVVEIFEVGEHRGVLYLAMEYIEATDLRAWLDFEVTPWREVLRIFVDAGRGLAAAHAVGLMHRDFKPSNVLLTADRRAIVVDFGLAKGLVDLSSTPSAPTDPPSSPSGSATGAHAFELDLTQTGALVGTPAYMAPEQLRGKKSDAAADQFAFCVSVWEGLFGERPFAGRTPKQVLESIERTVPCPPSRARDGSRVGKRVLEALQRGLSVDPAARWPRLDDLLDALAIAARRRHHPRILVAMALAVAGGTAVAAGSTPPPPCRPPHPALATWHAIDREDVARLYHAADRADAWDRVASSLDEYAVGLDAAWQQLCTLPAKEGLARDQIRACLGVRTAGAQTVVESVRASVPRDPERLLSGLEAIADCFDPVAGAVPASRDLELVRGTERDLARASVLILADEHEAALELVDELLRRDHVHRWEPLLARILLQRAKVLVSLGRHEDSMHALEHAFEAARRVGDDEAVLGITAKLAHVVGVEMNQIDRGLEWARHSESAARRLGRPEPLAHLHVTLGFIHVYGGHSEEAVEHLEAATKGLAFREQATPRERLDAHRDLGGVLLHLGRATTARQNFEAGLALAEQLSGPRSHDVAAFSYNLGTAIIAESGDYAWAQRQFARAAEIYREGLPADHPDIGDARFHAGLAMAKQGRLAEGEDDIRAGLEILERALGSEDVFVVQAKIGLAEVLTTAGDLEDARALAGPALTAAEARLGAAHPLSGRAARVLGDIAVERGDLDDARRYLERSLRGVEGTEPRTVDLKLETAVSFAGLEHRIGDLAAATHWALQAERSALELHGEPSARTSEVLLRILPILRAAGHGERVADRAVTALEYVVASAIDPVFRTTAGLEVARILRETGDEVRAAAIAQRALDRMPATTPPELRRALEDLTR
jgi:eukaryotic-like serine/threonine-protein kinase